MTRTEEEEERDEGEAGTGAQTSAVPRIPRLGRRRRQRQITPRGGEVFWGELRHEEAATSTPTQPTTEDPSLVDGATGPTRRAQERRLCWMTSPLPPGRRRTPTCQDKDEAVARSWAPGVRAQNRRQTHLL